MKIAIVHSFYRAGPSGENIAVQMQANALAEAGHEVRVISRSTDDFINQPGYALASGITAATGVGPSPLKEINEFGPDIVHVHNLFPNWGDRWLEKLTYPLVATIHNFRPLCAAATLSLNGSFCDLCPTQGSLHAIKNSCYGDSQLKSVPLAISTRKGKDNAIINRADRLIFLSPLTRDTFMKYLGPPIAARSEIVANFAESPVQASEMPAPASRNWIFVGRLSKEKGILPLVQHWPDSEKLEIVGEGPEKAKIDDAIRSKPNVSLSGPASSGEVFEALKRAKGLIFPSVCLESAPSLVYVEALSAGLPVVAKAGNAVAADVFSNDVGVVFQEFTDLPDALQQASEDQFRYSRNALRTFVSKFTKEQWLEKTLEVYRCLLTR